MTDRGRRVLAVAASGLLLLVAAPASWVGTNLTYGLVATVLSDPAHESVEWATISSDGRTLTVGYMGGQCESLGRAEIVEETSERVVVDVTYHASSGQGVCVLMGYPRAARFHLSEPLGDRTLYAWTIRKHDFGPIKVTEGPPLPGYKLQFDVG